MNHRQCYVYATSGLANWPFVLLGEVLKPTIARVGRPWFWYTFYSTEPWTDHQDRCPDAGYCWPDGSVRFLKVRYSRHGRKAFEQSLARRGRKASCASSFEGYDLVADLGQDRFIASEKLSGSATANLSRRTERAVLVRDFLHHLSALTLETLVKDSNGTWRLEDNRDIENYPFAHLGQSLHHFISNTSGNRLVCIPNLQTVNVGGVTVTRGGQTLVANPQQLPAGTF